MPRPSAINRRAFIRLAGVGGLSALLAACRGQLERMLVSPTPVTPIPWQTPGADLRPEMTSTAAASESVINLPQVVNGDQVSSGVLAGHQDPLEIHMFPRGNAAMVPEILQANSPRAKLDPDPVEEWQGIPLLRLTGRDFFGQLVTPLDPISAEVFQPGHDYLISYYVRSLGDDPVFFWMRPLVGGNSNGHGPHLASANIRRVWQVVPCVAPNRLGYPGDPTRPPQEPGEAMLYWLFQGHSNDGWTLDLRLGGFLIEDMGAAQPRGVAVMGDSTTEGFSNGTDHLMTREWTTWAAALLNTSFYNRAHFGWTTGDMRLAWGARITPLAPASRYCILQGGLNDVALSVPLEVIQANFTWMAQQAESEGMQPIICTATPYNVITNLGREPDRQALNAWLRTSFERVLDFDQVVRDPGDPSSLRKEDGWYGDGGHYDHKAKRALGEYIAGWPGWDLPQPGPYPVS